jgi:hypothetical protein
MRCCSAPTPPCTSSSFLVTPPSTSPPSSLSLLSSHFQCVQDYAKKTSPKHSLTEKERSSFASAPAAKKPRPPADRTTKLFTEAFGQAGSGGGENPGCGNMAFGRFFGSTLSCLGADRR